MKSWLVAGLAGLTRFFTWAQAAAGSESILDMSIAACAMGLAPPWQGTQLLLRGCWASVVKEVTLLQPLPVVPPSGPASAEAVVTSSTFWKAIESLALVTQLVR